MTGRRPLPAPVSGFAATWLCAQLKPEVWQRAARAMATNGRPDLAAELREAWLDLREAGRQWQESRGDEGSDRGTAELDWGAEATESSVVVAVSTGWAAEQLEVSEEMVRRLCRHGELSAVRVDGRGPWVIDKRSVADLRLRRSA